MTLLLLAYVLAITPTLVGVSLYLLAYKKIGPRA